MLLQESATSGALLARGDPEIDILPGPSSTSTSNTSNTSRKDSKSQRTPVPAWNLCLILLCCCSLLISTEKNNSADGVICELFQLYVEKNVKQSKRTTKYSRQIMIFCMTLAGYSARAYSFLRDAANKCLPSPNTLRNYRKRVDGSPGFSAAALQMIKRKVAELHEKSRHLFVSISCDDMSIRNIFYVKNSPPSSS